VFVYQAFLYFPPWLFLGLGFLKSVSVGHEHTQTQHTIRNGVMVLIGRARAVCNSVGYEIMFSCLWSNVCLLLCG